MRQIGWRSRNAASYEVPVTSDLAFDSFLLTPELLPRHLLFQD